MSSEEDLHMALCVVKVLALVVIASSLYSISNSLSRGMATDGLFTGQGPNASWVPGPSQSNNLGASAAGYGAVNSQAILGGFANYEPPVFYNVGDVSAYTPESLAVVREAAPVKAPLISGQRLNEVARGGMEGLRVGSIYG
jgi:hypothetical protein